MTHYKKLTFHHANLKKPLSIVAGTIAGWHWSDSTQATHLYTTGGIFPVEEKDEQITQMIEALNQKPLGQEKVNEPTKAVRRSTEQVRKRKARKDGRAG